MKCKFCQSELPESGVCPNCGTVNEIAPKKGKSVLWVVCGALLLCVAVFVVLGFTQHWFGGSEETAQLASDDTTAATGGQETASSTEQADELYAAAIVSNASYANTTAQPGSAEMKSVVATKEGAELTNAELNIYFWMEYYQFMQNYGSYASYFGLDSQKPLDQQQSMQGSEDGSGMTWEQYFLNAAANSYNHYKGIELAAAEDNYVLSDAQREYLDNAKKNLEEQAESMGKSSAEEVIATMYGSGVSFEDYMKFLKTNRTVYGYYTEVLEPQVTPTDAEVEAHYDENADSYAEKGTLKVNNIAVRHILLQPEELAEDADDAAKQAAKDKAKAEADRIYALWQEDPTEENFIKLAGEYSTDPGSKDNGGLYEDVSPGQMVQTFNDWCFDQSRKPGDSGIVETDYGYHIMYFVKTNETRAWFDTVKSELISEKVEALINSKTEKFHPAEFDFSKVTICDVVTANVGSAAE